MKRQSGYILEAIEKAGYQPGKDFVLALDAASSEWKSDKEDEYRLPKSGDAFSCEHLISHWESLCKKYPIFSIEDGLDEEDWTGWKEMTRRLGGKLQLVGDDLLRDKHEKIENGYQTRLRQFYTDKTQSNRLGFRNA